MSQVENRYKSVVSGLKWLTLASIGGRIITFGMGIILARYYLTPAQFGLVNMAAISVMAFDLIRDFGLVEALLKREQLNDEAADTAFWLLTVFASMAAAVVIILAPHIAQVFHEPALASYLYVMCLSLVTNGLAAVPLALLQKQDRWKAYASADAVFAIAGSATVLLLAIMGAREWSLVIGIVLKGIIQTSYAWWLIKWHPKLKFSVKTAKEMLGFGKWVTAVRFPDLFMYFADNAYLGRYAGKQNLGYYSQPYNWIQQPLTLFVSQVGKALYPNLAKSHDDLERRDLFLKSYQLLCWLVVPLYAFLGCHAQLFVDVIYGPKWAPSGKILVWLCAAATVRALTADGLQGYFWASNRGKQYAWPIWVSILFIFGAMVYSQGKWDGRQIAMLFTAGISLRGIINLMLLSTKSVKLTGATVQKLMVAFWPCALLAWSCHYLVTLYIANMTLQLISSMMLYGAGILLLYVGITKKLVKLSVSRQDTNS